MSRVDIIHRHVPVLLQVRTLKTNNIRKFGCSAVSFSGKYVQADIHTTKGIRAMSFDIDKYECIIIGLSYGNILANFEDMGIIHRDIVSNLVADA